MTRRLFTFGCSFTKYNWPTWADVFGLEFEHSENWGVAGIGNVGIAQRVAECHSKNTFTRDDIIIIQWSSHIRNDYHRFRSPPTGRDSQIGWKTKGSIFNYINQEIYDKKWQYHFFDEKSYIMYTLNSIFQTQQLLETVGCRYLMTTIGAFEKLGSDFEEANGFGETLSNTTNLWKTYPEFQHYQKIWDNSDNWCNPIGLHCWPKTEKMYKFFAPGDKEPWMDPHPSLDLHIDWLNSVVKSKLEIPEILTPIQQQWQTISADLKEQYSESDKFGFYMNRALPNWDTTYKGY
jgi:hypothetical protein